MDGSQQLLEPRPGVFHEGDRPRERGRLPGREFSEEPVEFHAWKLAGDNVLGKRTTILDVVLHEVPAAGSALEDNEHEDAEDHARQQQKLDAVNPAQERVRTAAEEEAEAGEEDASCQAPDGVDQDKARDRQAVQPPEQHARVLGAVDEPGGEELPRPKKKKKK